MGNYVSQSDVESRWGTGNVAAWSYLGTSTVTADTARIASAIAWAENYIDDRLRDGRYDIPLSPVTDVVKEWAATLAGVWLYRSRRISDRGGSNDTGEIVESGAASAEQEISMYQAGTRKGAWAQSTPGGAAPWVML